MKYLWIKWHGVWDLLHNDMELGNGWAHESHELIIIKIIGWVHGGWFHYGVYFSMVNLSLLKVLSTDFAAIKDTFFSIAHYEGPDLNACLLHQRFNCTWILANSLTFSRFILLKKNLSLLNAYGQMNKPLTGDCFKLFRLVEVCCILLDL